MNRRVLFLIDSLAVRRGTELHLVALAGGLRHRGFRPIVASLGGDEPLLQEIAARGVDCWARPMGLIVAPQGMRVLTSLVRDARGAGVQVVQSFHLKADLAASFLSARLAVPHVSSRRDLGFAETPRRRLARRLVLPRITRFIAPSTAVARTIESEGVDPRRIELIPNGVELTRFSAPADPLPLRESLNIPGGAPLVGMVAGLASVKDHRTLLGAMERVVRARPDARLVLVGEGPEESALRARVSALNLDAQVVFAGARTDIPDVLATLDLFVLATTSEGLSNAVLEAMAAGKPVIATDVGGNPDCVRDGVTGHLVPLANAQALATRILELIEHPERAQAMGHAGRARARDFSLDRMLDRSAALLDRVCAGRAQESRDAA